MTASADGSGEDAGIPRVACHDDILGEADRERIDRFLQAPEWEFGWKSRSRTDVYSFWHKHFAGYRKTGLYSVKDGRWPPPDCADELRKTSDLLFRFWTLLNGTLLKGHSLVRCYANAMPFGAEGTLHTDSTAPSSHTCIYYPHRIWHPNWAGETVFFDRDHSDVIASIYPKPNRLVLFRGDMPHVARGVSRTCPALRVTLVFKTEAPAP
ncbi:2OG-Fe(II) oxygenase [Gluconacetobacter sp. Hr-1-5]|uniref:2OG-Fe(II) oxygenase n=1 Tax=Gluconacetobacter sp. Hr-1-5 TaxID=3395370 RepID=UPI003B527A2A